MKSIKDKLNEISIKHKEITIKSHRILKPLKQAIGNRLKHPISKSPDFLFKKLRKLTPESDRKTPDATLESSISQDPSSDSSRLPNDIQIKSRLTPIKSKPRTPIKKLYKHKNSVNSLFIAHSTIYTASSDYTVRSWNLDTYKTRKVLSHKRSVISVRFSEQKLISASATGCLKIGKHTKQVQPRIVCMEVINSSSLLICGSTIEFFDIQTRAPFRNPIDEAHMINAISVHSEFTFCIGTEGVVKLLDTRAPRPIAQFEAHSDLVTGIYSEINSCYTCSLDGKLKLWDLRKNESITEKKTGNRLCQVAKYKNGVIAGGDQLNIWGEEEKIIKINDFIKDLAYDFDKDNFVLACSSGLLYICASKSHAFS
jgi:WD40 repeat protein